MNLDECTGLMLTTTTFIIASTVSYVNLVKVILMNHVSLATTEVFNTRLLFPSRDLGWWGQRNFAGRPLGAGRLPDSVDCHFSPSSGHQKIFLVLLNIFRLLLAVLAAVLFITVAG